MRNPHPKLQDFTPQSVYCALKEMCRKADLPDCFIEMCALSMSEEWDWEYNGITGRPDPYTPILFAWIHDFLWITGAGGFESDVIMAYLILQTGFSNFYAYTSYKAVRIAWKTPLIGYKAKHKRKGNVRPLSQLEEECFNLAYESLKKRNVKWIS